MNRPTVSPFDATIPVAYLPLNSHSHAFACYGPDVEQPFIIVDESVFEQAWCTEDHLLILLAHETAHIHNNSENEYDADVKGMDLMVATGDSRFEAAWELYQEEHCNRMRSGHYDK